MLDELGCIDVGDQNLVAVFFIDLHQTISCPVAFCADNHSVGVHKIVYSRPIPQKFRIGGHIKIGIPLFVQADCPLDPHGCLYGYSAFHRASDGAVVFQVLLNGIPIVPPLFSPPQAFNPYQEYQLKFSWSAEGLFIELDGDLIASLSAAVPPLPTYNEIFYIGEDYLRVNQLFGEVVKFEIWRDIEG